MKQPLDHLKAKLDQLSPEQRAELAQYLVRSLITPSGRKSARQKLSESTPGNKELRKLAQKHPPAEEWFANEEERPF